MKPDPHTPAAKRDTQEVANGRRDEESAGERERLAARQAVRDDGDGRAVAKPGAALQQGAAPAQSREVRLILAELSKVGCSAPVGQIEPCYRLERPPAQNCLSCRARLALDAAPTPEYVSGWLACQRVAIDDVAAAYHELMAPSRLSSEFFARRIRALAPPSAPPVSDALYELRQQVEDSIAVAVTESDSDGFISAYQPADAATLGSEWEALRLALTAVLPFAESRAEDMSEEVEVTPEEWHSEQSMEEAISLRDKAWAAVSRARAVLRRSGRHG